MESQQKTEGLFIFISYGHSDEYKDIVRRIVTDLKTRGHRVWFDEEQIRPGENFNEAIELGLAQLREEKDKARFLLLMTTDISERTAGNYSYCLNEIEQALIHRIETVPVLLSSKLTIPFRLSQIHYLDMRDCVPAEKKEETYQLKLKSLIRALEDRVTDHHFTLSEEGKMFKYLKPCEFEADFARHRTQFTGREWLKGMVENWVRNKPNERILVVKGDAGVGKTAFAVHLIDTIPEITAYHLSDYRVAEKANPFRVLKNLAFQLARKNRDYWKAICRMDPFEEIENQSRLSSLVDILFIQPLAGLLGQSEEQFVFLIDAIDELDVLNENDLIQEISMPRKPFPPNVKFILLSRPDEYVMKRFLIPPDQTIDIQSQENQQDYLADARKFLEHVINEKLSAPLPADSPVIPKILKNSDGLFLYVVALLESLKFQRDKISYPELLASIEDFPANLSGFYYKYFRERMQTDDMTILKEILACSFACNQNLPVPMILRILNYQNIDLNVIKVRLGSLFRVTSESIIPFHKTLYEWLLKEENSREFHINILSGHRILAEYGESLLSKIAYTGVSDHLEEVNPVESDLLLELPFHYLRLGNTDKIAEILTRPALFMRLFKNDRFQLMAYYYNVPDEGTFFNNLRLELEKMETQPAETLYTIRAYHLAGLFSFILKNYRIAAYFLLKALSILEPQVTGKKPDSKEGSDQEAPPQPTAEQKHLLGVLYNDLAENFLNVSMFKEAKAFYQKAIRILYRANKWTVEAADAINNYGHVFFHGKQYDRCEKLYNKAFKIRKAILPPLHRAIAESHFNLGMVMLYNNNRELGIIGIRSAINIHEKAGRTFDQDYALYLLTLAEMQVEQKEFTEGIPLVERALAIRIALYGAKHALTTEAIMSLESAYLSYKRANPEYPIQTPGESLLDVALERRARILPPDNDEFIPVYFIRALTHIFRGDNRGTRENLHKANVLINQGKGRLIDVVNISTRQAYIYIVFQHEYETVKEVIQSLFHRVKTTQELSGDERFRLVADILSYFVSTFLNLSMEERKRDVEIMVIILPVIEAEFLKDLEKLIQTETNKPLFRNISIAYNEVAFHKFMPEKNYGNAEKYFTTALRYMKIAGDAVECANMTLNLQTAIFKAGKPVDYELIKTNTNLLRQHNDDRYVKGDLLLGSGNMTLQGSPDISRIQLQMAFAVSVADRKIDRTEIGIIAKMFNLDADPEIRKTYEDLNKQVNDPQLDIPSFIANCVNFSVARTQELNLDKKEVEIIIRKLLAISAADSRMDPAEVGVIFDYARHFDFDKTDLFELFSNL
ncbi:MAG: TIR domain-containing protein [Bacteroidetes bacterium]|nr:TIR domain-containing protein [Bacteroidota bacterium]